MLEVHAILHRQRCYENMIEKTGTLSDAYVEIREVKETLIKFNKDLEKAIAVECRIGGALKAAAGSCDNIVSGICNAIVKAERDTNFKATITPEQLAELRQLIDHSIESWTSVLKNHQVEQTKLITEHESNMRKILRQNEGVWFSDFWMKVYVIFLFVYTIGLGLVVYCAT